MKSYANQVLIEHGEVRAFVEKGGADRILQDLVLGPDELRRRFADKQPDQFLMDAWECDGWYLVDYDAHVMHFEVQSDSYTELEVVAASCELDKVWVGWELEAECPRDIEQYLERASLRLEKDVEPPRSPPGAVSEPKRRRRKRKRKRKGRYTYVEGYAFEWLAAARYKSGGVTADMVIQYAHGRGGIAASLRCDDRDGPPLYGEPVVLREETVEAVVRWALRELEWDPESGTRHTVDLAPFLVPPP